MGSIIHPLLEVIFPLTINHNQPFNAGKKHNPKSTIVKHNQILELNGFLKRGYPSSRPFIDGLSSNSSSSPATLPRRTPARWSWPASTSPAPSGAAGDASRACCHADAPGHRVDLDIKWVIHGMKRWEVFMGFSWDVYAHMRTMVLEYLPT